MKSGALDAKPNLEERRPAGFPGAIGVAPAGPVKVLIAEDEPTMLSLMSSALEGRRDCRLSLAANGLEALAKLKVENPDLLITDLRMPRMSGEDLTFQALDLNPDITVLITTGNGTVDGAVRLLKRGVFDYLTKPFQVDAFVTTVDRAIARVHSHSISRESADVLASLLKVLEMKDPYLKDHSVRVAALSRRLAADIGLSLLETVSIERASLVHDLGKVGVPETILNKPGPLTREEYDCVKKHPEYSVDIVRDLKEFRACIHYVYHHHERYDGKGYPMGLAGEGIPLGARVIAVCDAYDAMSSDRPYRMALGAKVVRGIMIEARGTHLDADLVDVFLERRDEEKQS